MKIYYVIEVQILNKPVQIFKCEKALEFENWIKLYGKDYLYKVTRITEEILLERVR